MVYFTSRSAFVSAFYFSLWLTHLSDVVTDFLYIVCTPFYSMTLKVFAWVFFFAPIIAFSTLAYTSEKPKKCNYFWTMYLELVKTSYDPDGKEVAQFASTNRILFVILEEGAQLLIQTINSLYIGNSYLALSHLTYFRSFWTT